MSTGTDCYSDQLKNTLLVRLPGAGSDAIDLEMGNSAHEFFLASGAWHELVYANMVADRTHYELWPSEGSVGYICDLTIDGRNYKPVTSNALMRRRWTGAFQVLTEFGHLDLEPAPLETKPKAIIANISVVPGSCYSTIPPDILNHYYEALLDNALSNLYSHTNKPYSNAQLALFHKGKYWAHLARARRIVAGGNVRAGGPWIYPQIAPGRSRRGSAMPRGV